MATTSGAPVTAGLLIGAGVVGALLWHSGRELREGGPVAGAHAGCCQLCLCNGGVVACPVAGVPCPAGSTCSMCNGPGGSVVPCMGTPV